MSINSEYDTLNARVLAAVPTTGRRILDVGCGAGRLGKHLKARQPCHVTGITHSRDEAQIAREWLDDVKEVDLDRFSGILAPPFDVVVLSHILEHIRSPEVILPRVLESAAPGATVIVALPNVLWWRQRLEFMLGRFRYADAGIMDRTHVHFFDRGEAFRLLQDAGLALLREEMVGECPGSRFLGPIRPAVDRLAVKAAPGLFSFEFIFVCRNSESGEGGR